MDWHDQTVLEAHPSLNKKIRFYRCRYKMSHDKTVWEVHPCTLEHGLFWKYKAFHTKRIEYIRVEFTRKKCKTAILLYCFHTAHILLYNLMGLGTSVYRKDFLKIIWFSLNQFSNSLLCIPEFISAKLW